ncbi:MAG: metal ABC transporter substrate-binding protein [Bacilli bacterium]|nr:metal ABC transporter substrate-binding protein [Bacilli bacterium]MDD3305032.1 metal ABC transporter substrate-binding protein [Bacilli bacterium]MDD4053637.1 metal ABC transporter substrate-binding protein [Bacilli bacterium]MDD4411136.1 metal ABC transporter substrate-binding protein [Bacilli bacterium]
MKKKYFIVLAITLIAVTGCFKKDSLENVTIYTTNYPVEYITEKLYGNNGKIYSIYPNDININNYNLTDKQLTDYSKGRIFIYNGLSNEKDYAITMLNKNKNLLIIDAAMSMEYTHEEEEIWLDPSNFLMMAQNIKEGFKEYITNTYLEREIDENYEKLKIEMSEIDAELNLIVENAADKNIVVADDMLIHLEKYGLNVLSLEENEKLTDKRLSDVEKLINSGVIKHVFVIDDNELSETAKNLITKYNLTPISYRTGTNLSEAERNEEIDFIKIMNNNIEALKVELYQ